MVDQGVRERCSSAERTESIAVRSSTDIPRTWSCVAWTSPASD
jgi:hypothetical protein